MFFKNSKSLKGASTLLATSASASFQYQHQLQHLYLHTVDAPFNDLEFLKNIVSYKETDAEVAEAAFKELLSHRWYT